MQELYNIPPTLLLEFLFIIIIIIITIITYHVASTLSKTLLLSAPSIQTTKTKARNTVFQDTNHPVDPRGKAIAEKEMQKRELLHGRLRHSPDRYYPHPHRKTQCRSNSPTDADHRSSFPDLLFSEKSQPIALHLHALPAHSSNTLIAIEQKVYIEFL